MGTRNKILEAAFNLIASNGYDKTSISMICDEVGVKKPTLYYYFESKEILYVTLIKEFLSGGKSVKFDLNASKKDFQSQLEQYGLNFIATYENSPTFGKFVMEIYIQSKRIENLATEIDEMNIVFKNELKNIVACGERLEILSEEDRNTNCDMLFTAIHGIEFSIIFGTDINHVDVWINTIKNLCERNK